MKLKISFLFIFFGINITCLGASKIDPSDVKRTQEDSTLLDKSSCSSADLKEEKEKKEDNETKLLIELQKIGSSEKTSGIMPIELSRIIMSYIINTYPSKLKEGFPKSIFKNKKFIFELNLKDKLYISNSDGFVTIIDKKTGEIQNEHASNLKIAIGDKIARIEHGRLVIFHNKIPLATIRFDKIVELESGKLLVYEQREILFNVTALNPTYIWTGTSLIPLPSFNPQEIKSVLELSGDKLAILAIDSIYNFDIKNQNIINRILNISINDITHLLKLRNNKILYALNDGQLLIRDGLTNQGHVLQANNDVSIENTLGINLSVEYLQILETTNEIIIGVSLNGSVSVWDPKQKKSYYKTYKILNPKKESATCILELKDGKIAIGTDIGSIIIFNPEDGNFEKIEKVIGSYISHLYQSDNCNLLAVSLIGNAITILTPTIDVKSQQKQESDKIETTVSTCCTIL